MLFTLSFITHTNRIHVCAYMYVVFSLFPGSLHYSPSNIMLAFLQSLTCSSFSECLNYCILLAYMYTCMCTHTHVGERDRERELVSLLELYECVESGQTNLLFLLLVFMALLNPPSLLSVFIRS